MKIIELTAENVKKLKVVDITPTGNIVEITGDNGAGKSSVLDSIYYALAGTTGIPSQPIRNGTSKATIKLDMGEIVVTRRFTQAGTTLTVESADGSRFPTPQKMLDQLVGSLTFDPLAFSRMAVNPEGRRKQLEELRKLVKLSVDVDALDLANRRDFDERTNVNRQIANLKSRAEAIQVAPDTPAQEIDVSALISKLEDAGKVNATVASAKARKQSLEDSIANAKRQADSLSEASVSELQRAELAAKNKRDRGQELIASANAEAKRLIERAKAEATRLEAEAETLISEGKAKSERISREAEQCEEAGECARQELAEWSCPDAVDTALVKAEIQTARSKNEQVARRKQKADIVSELKTYEKEEQEITRRMQNRSDEKQSAIASAQMPIPGLSFGDGEVLFNGIPLAQASSSEKLKISTAIAMAANPKLRIIRIQDGSLLDTANMKALEEMANTSDFQIWIERVQQAGKVAVVMEDGQVKQGLFE